jgi:hypothetical protein
MELLEFFESSSYFRQLILILESEFGYELLAKENVIQKLVSRKNYSFIY